MAKQTIDDVLEQAEKALKLAAEKPGNVATTNVLLTSVVLLLAWIAKHVAQEPLR